MTASWKTIQRHLRRHRLWAAMADSGREERKPANSRAPSSPRSPSALTTAPRSPVPGSDGNRSLQRVLGVGLGITFLVLSLRGLGLLQGLELDAYDLMMSRLLPPHPTAPVVVVGFDEDFLAQPGAWPISDDLLARLLQGIATSKPAAIGLDIYRDVPIGRGRDELVHLYRTLPNLYGIHRLADQFSPEVRPPDLLARQHQVGFNNVVVDADGRVRRSVLFWWTEDKVGHQSLSLKLAGHYLSQQGIHIAFDEKDPDKVTLGQTTFAPLERNSGPYRRKDTAGYQIFADFRGARGTIPMVLAQDIIDANFDPGVLANRIVLVGVVADSIRDSFYTSYTSTDVQRKQSVFGVEIQAQFVAQLLDLAQGDRPMIQSWSEGAELLWILAWCMAGAALGSWGQYPLRSSVWGMIGAVELLVLSYIALLSGLWIPVIPPLLGGGTTLIMVMLLSAQQHYESERSKEFLNSVIAAVPEPVFVQDNALRWVVVNPAFEALVEYPLNQLLNQQPEDVLPPSSAALFKQVGQSLPPLGKPQVQEAQFWSPSGQEMTVILKRSLHCDRAGNLFLVGTLQDITAQKRLERRLTQRTQELARHNAQLQRSHRKLHHQATHDPLTRLGNRQFLYQELARLLGVAETDQGTLGVLFLDLDGFKGVNDDWGHQAGDEILVETAQRLIHVLRGSDVIARLAGDEFVVVLPDIPYPQVADHVSQKIIHVIAQPFVLRGDRFPPAPSAPLQPATHDCTEHARCGAAVETGDRHVVAVRIG